MTWRHRDDGKPGEGDLKSQSWGKEMIRKRDLRKWRVNKEIESKLRGWNLPPKTRGGRCWRNGEKTEQTKIITEICAWSFLGVTGMGRNRKKKSHRSIVISIQLWLGEKKKREVAAAWANMSPPVLWLYLSGCFGWTLLEACSLYQNETPRKVGGEDEACALFFFYLWAPSHCLKLKLCDGGIGWKY